MKNAIKPLLFFVMCAICVVTLAFVPVLKESKAKTEPAKQQIQDLNNYITFESVEAQEAHALQEKAEVLYNMQAETAKIASETRELEKYRKTLKAEKARIKKALEDIKGISISCNKIIKKYEKDLSNIDSTNNAVVLYGDLRNTDLPPAAARHGASN
jgi:SMC interacting uncharacterized protein involved in chromosome segregation